MACKERQFQMLPKNIYNILKAEQKIGACFNKRRDNPEMMCLDQEFSNQWLWKRWVCSEFQE
jgi:hypothetical protein